MDELNSVLGALGAVLSQESKELIEEIQSIQSDLLHLGAWLATTPDSPSLEHLKEISQDQIKALELAIDRMQKELPALQSFILPTGHISAAWAHVARTVCRRAERRVVRLSAGSTDSKERGRLGRVITYLNRLSDYFFVLARYCNQVQGVPDIPWRK